MTSVGKAFRLQRLTGPRGNLVMIPMDHGVSLGPAPGLERPADAVRAVREGGASSIAVHKGLVRPVLDELGGMGLFVHLSASTSLNPDPNDKRLVGTVEEAVRLGADGISVHVNVGAPEESRMVEDLGRVATDCDRFGMPLLAMMYPRGKDIHDPHNVDLVKQVARLGAELGADIVKCPYTGDVDTFREVVDGCPVPVIISGGPRIASEADLLQVVHGTMEAGGRGVSFGRNVWQHPRPANVTRAVSEIVFNGASVEDALRALKQ